VRLVKGAYWDAEVKRAQVEGQAGYPVFTRKQNTDVSYLANARRLLDAGDAIYPMFATHNAQTIATVHRMARAMRGRRDFEFQKLHGMGDDLYAEVIPADRLDVPCRVYAPVGSHEDLLPYLVRRLLENGANSSFVNRITDESISIDELIRDPVEPCPASIRSRIRASRCRSTSTAARKNTGTIPWASTSPTTTSCANSPQPSTTPVPAAGPQRRWYRARTRPAQKSPVTNPADRREVVGQWQAADSATVERALQNAVAAHPAGMRCRPARAPRSWNTPPKLLEARMPAYMAMCTKEAGKTLPDGIAEVREAVDFLRYYACRHASISRRSRCPARPANPTSCSSAGAACSCASRRGISRWRSSWARSPPRWPPATR
jgi:RHH-type proline utilization regulon transcriptional repressor/proline dehydrogenase/delta 1-pyrroline-5-carboxylate dehydrogenase